MVILAQEITVYHIWDAIPQFNCSFRPLRHSRFFLTYCVMYIDDVNVFGILETLKKQVNKSNGTAFTKERILNGPGRDLILVSRTSIVARGCYQNASCPIPKNVEDYLLTLFMFEKL